VRVSAKELTSLILDEERLRVERSDRKSWKSRVTGIEEYGGSDVSPPPRRQERERPQRGQRAQRADEEDAEYQLALEASKYQEEEDRKKRESKQGEPDDDDLAKAIRLSKEEEELRRRELESTNAAALFDDDLIQTNQPQFTGYNQGYQQQGAVDWSGNPIGMNTQQTGFMVTYSDQNQQFQNQQNGYQNDYSNGFAPQPTGYDPYAQQQQQQQQQFVPQPTGYNPYQQQQQEQQLQPELLIPANTNNPWATTNQQTHLQPTPTGSNNPFAQSIPTRPTLSSSFSQPTLSTLQEQKTMSQFNNTSSFNPPTSFSPPAKAQTPYEAKLSSLLETGDGMDTFGNVGNLRIPAQHTAPGTFVNSAGAGLGRVNVQATGNNPFLNNQFTGMPQTQYGGQQFPAQTGPAGYVGGIGGQAGNNPFGRAQGGQNGQGNLIDF
jgi:epsin